MPMEEIIKSPVGSFILSGLLFFIQLYFRSTLAEIKKGIADGRAEYKEGLKKIDTDYKAGIAELKAEAKNEILNVKADIQMLFSRVNRTDQKATTAGTEIENMKEDIKEIKADCKARHR